jgi:oxalate decarboxylase
MNDMIVAQPINGSRGATVARLPVPAALDTVRKQLPNDPPPLPYVFHASKVAANKFDGGSTKVIDHRQFPETSLSALIINLEPGALREIHWHPDADELQYYIKGEARMTVFDAPANARTFNYRAGDVGYVPKTLYTISRIPVRSRCGS